MHHLSPLYCILDYTLCQKNQIEISSFVQQYFQAGGKILQYRDKANSYPKYLDNVHAICKIARECQNSLIIINEFHEKILTKNFSNAMLGFHFGQDDIKKNSIYQQCQQKGYAVGISTHSSHEVAIAKKLSPDYIGLGAVFQSQTKPLVNVLSHRDIKKITNSTAIPIVLIGGITQKNIKNLPKANHVGYAIVSDIYRYKNQPQGIYKYTREMLNILDAV